jgi:hypothetical protein
MRCKNTNFSFKKNKIEALIKKVCINCWITCIFVGEIIKNMPIEYKLD